ncbi:MFS transporter [Penicillium atrosanguineum]|uniref:MFS transporter n=1 Tax=Penicillium atrosanguineum TaxID=1132637 RepID=A0A9W9H6L2_9EURO|nr:uncharacterized protein N7443_002011 [Penicillium atrosanguineum]KAJ5121902.1 MFS transporter [Penicillium atrosanguineum]KAJ5139627.1 MFS transporter [Penicillium atrosanguineum]KAJ5309550.1 hypothetical protein N7443_002011 [Penicillium atrosanguineum]KAJ5315069.1 MFS transporter [Penicillium atrosanguineum]
MITVIETFGLLLSGPLLAALIREGLIHGNVRWLGLPFIVAGAMGVLVAVTISCINLPAHAKGGESEDLEDSSVIAG